MDKILELINKENKKKPLTDSEIAKILGMHRGDVVKFRHSKNIGDSRGRRKKLLETEFKKVLKENPDISERAVTRKLNEAGFEISRNIVSKMYKTFSPEIVQVDMDKTEEKEKTQVQTNAFLNLIGSCGSLKPKIQLAKAAILYPPNGLHTLISGPTGVGKSELAECMYRFAVQSKVKSEESAFVVFNCADYAENPQLLLAQLFGYCKGAYTGADNDKEGLVQKANNGILFLDEIHRLPPEGQEILFYLLDKGKYRRLGETEVQRKVNVMMIAATTEDVESSLLATFRRRIPMLIELPSLDNRPLEERFNIIELFFRAEATRINAKIIASYNVLSALLLYDAKGNVGQLRSDIQVTCARAFLKYMAQKEKVIKIEISDLPSHVARGLLNINHRRQKLSNFLKGDLEIAPCDEKCTQIIRTKSYMMPKDVYKDIEQKYQMLESQGIDNLIINRIIGDELETKIQQFVKQIRYNRQILIKNDLQKIVGEKIINAVESMMNKAKNEIDSIDESLFYCLSTHLSASYERLLQNKKIKNPQLENIKKDYSKEYNIALEMAKIAQFYLGVELPEDEVGIIAMYLKAYSRKNILDENRVGVVVLSHGHVAEGMVNVANRLLGEEHAKAVEMSLDESPKKVLQRAEEVVKQANQGKGVLLLVDMGSLISFGNIISEKYGISIRNISRVDTLMVIEAVRKALLPNADLNEIADSLEKDKFAYEVEVIQNEKLPDALVSMCLTGEGTAESIKKIVLGYMPEIDEKIEIVNQAALTNQNFIENINKLSKVKNILAILGTINPKIPGIPFISSTEIMKGQGVEKLRNIIKNKAKIKLKSFNEERVPLKDLIKSDLVILNSQLKNKKEIIKYMAGLMEEKGYVSEKFIISVYQREMMAPTIFKRNIAIPHGNPEDVIRQAIGIITLKEPVEWYEGYKVDCIFVLALNAYSKDEFRKLYEVINDDNLIDKIKKVRTAEQLKGVITSGKEF